MVDMNEIIKGLESLRDICNARSNIFVGDARIVWAGYGKTASDAITLIEELRNQITLMEHEVI